MKTDFPYPETNFIFKCKNCGYCCCGDHGYIWVDESEIKKISRYLDITADAFKNKYTVKSNGKITIKEVRNGDSLDCIFYNNNEKGCGIYSVRPTQCRTYPFWKEILTNKIYLDETLKDCPGLNLKNKKDD